MSIFIESKKAEVPDNKSILGSMYYAAVRNSKRYLSTTKWKQFLEHILW